MDWVGLCLLDSGFYLVLWFVVFVGDGGVGGDEVFFVFCYWVWCGGGDVVVGIVCVVVFL